MSTTTADGATRPLVPRDFDDYLAANYGPMESVSTKACSGCGNSVAIVRECNGNVYCHGCLRYSFGCDAAEEKMVRAIIGGAVAAALGAGASEELVHLAVQDALGENVRVEGDWITS